MKLSIITCCLLLIPLAASAQWTGFPFRVNTMSNTYDSFQLVQDYRPFHQINSALVERCSVAGIAAPTNIQYWSGLWAGTNQSIVTQVVGVVTNVYTNWVTLITNAWTTNVMGGFEYQYTDYSGAHTTTGYTYLTHDYLVAVDTKIQALCTAGFIVTNYESFLTNRNVVDTKPPEWADLKDSFVNIMQREGIGYTTNLTTNAWGLISGGTANFTHSPASTNRFVLAQTAHRSNTVWDFHSIKTNDANMYDTSKPMVQYFPAGTNAFSAFSVTITGTVLTVASSQTIAPTSEVVSITSSNGVSCSGQWWAVTGITCTTQPPNTGDCVEVVYTNTRAVYSDWPWDLSDIARDLDERWTVINALQWTYNACSNSIGKWYNPEQRVFHSTDGWATLLSQYSTYYDTGTTNWIDFATNKNPSAMAFVETIHYGLNDDTFSILGGDSGGVKANNYGTYFASDLSTSVAHSAVLYGKDKVTLTAPPPTTNLNLLGFVPHPTDFTFLSYPYYQQVNGLTMNTNIAIVSSNYFIVPFTNLFNIYTSTPETLSIQSHGDSFTWVLKWTFNYR
jgi:hypothetical protein